MIEDLGNLADYVLNGDNYERVDESGNTLVIPTVYQGNIIVPPAVCGNDQNCVPIGGDFTWNLIDPSCDFDHSPICIAHDATTGFYFFALDCEGETIGIESADDCFAACAAYLAQIDGGPLDGAFPNWLIEVLYPTDFFSELPLLDIDFFFVACPGERIVIPNFPGPIPVNCTPPNLAPFNGLCQNGYTLEGLCCVPKAVQPPPKPCCTSYSFWQKCCLPGAPS